jgi:hypothetical protein
VSRSRSLRAAEEGRSQIFLTTHLQKLPETNRTLTEWGSFEQVVELKRTLTEWGIFEQ